MHLKHIEVLCAPNATICLLQDPYICAPIPKQPIIKKIDKTSYCQTTKMF